MKNFMGGLLPFQISVLFNFHLIPTHDQMTEKFSHFEDRDSEGSVAGSRTKQSMYSKTVSPSIALRNEKIHGLPVVRFSLWLQLASSQ
jgi:hypothetical protein